MEMKVTSPLSRRTWLKGSLLSLAAAGAQRRSLLAAGPAKSIRSPRVPRVADRFVHIYKPEADVYTLPTVTSKPADGSFTYTQGARYPDWRTNDHTFIQGPDQRWHCFGITKPWMNGDNGHAGEGLCFHAIAPEGTFAQALQFQSWKDLPKIDVAGCGWAPTSIRIGDEYSLIGSRLGRATSTDLLKWTDQGRLDIQGGNRDPQVRLLNGTYYLVRCAANGINLVTSKDFIHWSEPKVIYRPPQATWQTESPSLIPYGGLFYLFWTLWDTADPTTGGYCPRSYVICSESPDDFHDRPVLAGYTVHAPEIVESDGQWFMSTAEHPNRGISVAPLVWE